jgi:hypothetical protein
MIGKARDSSSVTLRAVTASIEEEIRQSGAQHDEEAMGLVNRSRRDGGRIRPVFGR